MMHMQAMEFTTSRVEATTTPFADGEHIATVVSDGPTAAHVGPRKLILKFSSHPTGVAAHTMTPVHPDNPLTMPVIRSLVVNGKRITGTAAPAAPGPEPVVEPPPFVFNPAAPRRVLANFLYIRNSILQTGQAPFVVFSPHSAQPWTEYRALISRLCPMKVVCCGGLGGLRAV
jgi:hypothetical protein